MRRITGFTLIELMITVAILGVIVAFVAPSFSDALERRRLERAGEDVLSAVNFARSEAIKKQDRNNPRDVTISFETSGGGWCFGLDDDNSTACDCANTPANCTIDGQQRVTTNNLGTGAPYGDVTYLSASSTIDDDDITFDHERGMAPGENGKIVLQSEDGNYHYCVVVSTIGRVRVSSDMIGYQDDGNCP